MVQKVYINRSFHMKGNKKRKLSFVAPPVHRDATAPFETNFKKLKRLLFDTANDDCIAKWMNKPQSSSNAIHYYCSEIDESLQFMVRYFDPIRKFDEGDAIQNSLTVFDFDAFKLARSRLLEEIESKWNRMSPHIIGKHEEIAQMGREESQDSAEMNRALEKAKQNSQDLFKQFAVYMKNTNELSVQNATLKQSLFSLQQNAHELNNQLTENNSKLRNEFDGDRALWNK